MYVEHEFEKIMCARLDVQMILTYVACSTKSIEAFVQGVVWAGHCLLWVRCPRKATFPIRHRLNLRIPSVIKTHTSHTNPHQEQKLQ